MQDSDGRLWIGTVNGVVVADIDSSSNRIIPRTNLYNQRCLSRKRSKRSCRAQMADLDWHFRRIRQVRRKLKEGWRYFTAYTTAEGLSDNDILSLFEDTDGNLWAGTESGA